MFSPSGTYLFRTSRKASIAALITAIASVLAAQTQEPVSVFHEENKDGTFSVLVSTDIPCPIQLYVTFPVLENVRWDEQLPLDYIVVPDAKRAKMITFTPGAGKMSFRYETSWWFGDPETAHHDDSYMYQLPFTSETIAPVVQGYLGSLSHQGEYAIDFRMREGTRILAAREGYVIGVRSDSQIGGPDPSYRQDANYVMIYHNDGTFAQYAHLKYKGAAVRRGQFVGQGELIGFSGDTGYSMGPHLHFVVYTPTHHGSDTVPTRFRDHTGKVFMPQ